MYKRAPPKHRHQRWRRPATSAPAVGYTVEQVRAQQNDRIFRRAVQNLHVQIIEVTGEHARPGDEACEALEKLPAKDIDRAQSERRRPSCACSPGIHMGSRAASNAM